MNNIEWLDDITKYGSVLGLDSIKKLLELMGNPHKGLKVVHCAGTNGKGSTLSFVQNICMCAGYRVGRYSSPAVFDRWEIIRINDECIDSESVDTYVGLIREACSKMLEQGYPHPTIFEVETALAFLYFKENNCDIALIECGMGGKEDATNVFDEVLCSVITPISLDHTAFLGSTLSGIAKVKGGIIKEGCPVVISNQSEEATNELLAIGGENAVVVGKSKNIKIEDGITFFEYNEKLWKIKLKGSHQIVNATAAIEVANILNKKGYNLSKYIEEGLLEAKWPGRLETICENPLIVIDGAHNPGAVKSLLEAIDLYFTNKRITFIMGVLADKDFAKEAEIIANRAENIVAVTPNNARGLDGTKLKDTLVKYNSNVAVADNISNTLDIAKQAVSRGESDMILAFGSLSYLRELKESL